MFCNYQNSPILNILQKKIAPRSNPHYRIFDQNIFLSACSLLKGICLKNIMEICGWKWIVTDSNHKYHTQNSLPTKILEKLFFKITENVQIHATTSSFTRIVFRHNF